MVRHWFAQLELQRIAVRGWIWLCAMLLLTPRGFAEVDLPLRGTASSEEIARALEQALASGTPIAVVPDDGSTAPQEIFPIPAIERQAPPARFLRSSVPAIDVAFDAIAQVQLPTGEFARPPDTHIAVGPSSIVEITNGHVAIYLKDGSLIAGGDSGPGAITLSAFTGIEGTFDPKVRYDPYAERFVAVVLSGPFSMDNAVHIVVSTTSTPGNLDADWLRFSHPGTANIGGIDGWFDYPGIGVTPDVVVVTGNIFNFIGTGLGSKVRIFDANDLYDGDPNLAYTDIEVAGVYTMQPAMHLDVPSAGTAYLVCTNSSGPQQLSLWALSGAPTSPSLVETPIAIDLGGSTTRRAPQLGSFLQLDTVPYRLMDAVWRDGSIWGAATYGLNDKSVVRWFEISTVGAVSLAQDGTIDGGDGEWTFVPSLSVDPCGNMAVVYTQSSATRYPEIRYTGRAGGDPAGFLRDPVVVRESPTFYEDYSGRGHMRWGDYAAVVVDPIDASFWLAHQYAKSPPINGADGRWGTHVAQVSFAALSLAKLALAPNLLEFTIPAGSVTAGTLAISNDGCSNLLWEITEAELASLKPSPKSAAPAVDLVIDDGSAEFSIGGFGSFLWLNRFTPAPEDHPFTLSEIAVYLPASGASVGDLIDVYVWEDSDGDEDPGTGARLLASLQDQAVTSVDAFSIYAVPQVVIDGPGDVLIGVVNRTGGLQPSETVAAVDAGVSARRSWLGTYTQSPPDPPELPADGIWGLIDDLGPTGNFLIRGYGVVGGNCPWLSTVPISGGITAGDTQVVALDVDAGALGAGTQLCDLRVHSDDPDFGTLIVSVVLNTTSYIQPAMADLVYGSTSANDGGQLVTIDPGSGETITIGSSARPSLDGLAINSRGEIYGTSAGDLLRIDPASGASILVGATGLSAPRGITFDPNDVLYAIDATTGNLHRIDPVTASVTYVGSTAISQVSGLASDPLDGRLYVSTNHSSGSLFIVNRATGGATYIGATGLPGPVLDLTFDRSGALYGSFGAEGVGSSLIQIDKLTGLGTVIGPMGLSSVSGLALITSDLATGAPDSAGADRTHFLRAAAPNPFNPRTQIRFGLPIEQQVRIDVFDARGRRVATLVDERMPAGEHVLTFDGEDQASGVYFYRMQTDSFSAVRKMTLLK